MKSHSLTHAKREKLQAQLRLCNQSHAALGRKYGVTRQRVQQIAKMINAPTHSEKMKGRRQGIIQQLRLFPEKTRSQIARENKTYPGDVCRIAKKIGLKTKAEMMAEKRRAIGKALISGMARNEVARQLNMPIKLVNEVGKSIGK
ncbi:hypothetical protein [Xanthomonas axonopodis]